MIAIYGDWGSGKSSLFKTLSDSTNPDYKLDNSIFSVMTFKTWEYESDPNLAFSLFEFIADNIEEDWKNKAYKNGKKLGEEIYEGIKGFAKATTFNLGFITVDSSKIIEGQECLAKKRIYEESFYKKRKNFKDAFNKLIGDKKIIVFIDELDRCENENILSLLSAIKLFFCLGENILFITGVDKNAIVKALELKYGNNSEKAEEYLEKIFPINFSMPKNISLDEIIRNYFSEFDESTLISDMLVELNVSNPRKIKKILNKFLVLKKIGVINDEINPNINTTLIILFLILFHENYEDFFYKVFNLNQHIKVENYTRYSFISSNGSEKAYGLFSMENFGLEYCFFLPFIEQRILFKRVPDNFDNLIMSISDNLNPENETVLIFAKFIIQQEIDLRKFDIEKIIELIMKWI